ncbi:MAG: pirin family protein [Mycobacterium leprae]
MQRSVAQIVPTTWTTDGEGIPVGRPFPSRSLSIFDPFLLLDNFRADIPPGEPQGFPDHPHRGFETVTYVLEGRMEHRDSFGHEGQIGPGDVQWMTAGVGVVHSELTEPGFSRQGGRLYGFQLWVNLPARDKLMQPRYQEVPARRIPVAQNADGTVAVKVIAGEALGARAVIETRTPIIYLHYDLQPGAQVVQAVPYEYNAFVYVISGEGSFGADGRRGAPGDMLLFDNQGDEISLAAATPLSLLLIAGLPLNEPVARYGPFVMNTEAEIRQAFADYRAGLMGRIEPLH